MANASKHSITELQTQPLIRRSFNSLQLQLQISTLFTNKEQRKKTNPQAYRRLEHHHQPTGPNWSYLKNIEIHILFKFTWDISQRRPYVNHETSLQMLGSFETIEYVL